MSGDGLKTNVTCIAPGKILIRGYDISELMGRRSFADIVFLILKGELPSENEGRLMDAILSSSIDHGPAPLSSFAARMVVSGGNSLSAAVAGGMLTVGESHGNAIERCACILQEWALRDGPPEEVAHLLKDHLSARKMHVPGYGHRLHKIDPRAVRLFELADKFHYSGRHQNLARELEAIFKHEGKGLYINIDGAIAAVISDMGFDWRLGKGFFMISRVVGLVAQAYEEKTRERSMLTLANCEYEYDGPHQRHIGR